MKIPTILTSGFALLASVSAAFTILTAVFLNEIIPLWTFPEFVLILDIAFFFPFSSIIIYFYCVLPSRYPETNAKRKGNTGRRILLIVISIEFVLNQYLIGPGSEAFRTGPFMLTNYHSDILAAGLITIVTFLWLFLRNDRMEIQVKGNHRKALFISTTIMVCFALLSTSFSVPLVATQQITPPGQGYILPFPGAYGSYKVTFHFNGTLHGNITSTHPMTDYVLSNQQFQELSNLTSPGEPPLNWNYTLPSYLYVNRNVLKDTFSLSLGPGTYWVVMFNNNISSGTNITVRTLTLTMD